MAAGGTSQTAAGDGTDHGRRRVDRRRVRRDDRAAAVGRRDALALGGEMMRADDERDVELRDLGADDDDLARRRAASEARDVDYDYIFGDDGGNDVRDDVDDELVERFIRLIN